MAEVSRLLHEGLASLVRNERVALALTLGGSDESWAFWPPLNAVEASGDPKMALPDLALARKALKSGRPARQTTRGRGRSTSWLVVPVPLGASPAGILAVGRRGPGAAFGKAEAATLRLTAAPLGLVAMLLGFRADVRRDPEIRVLRRSAEELRGGMEALEERNRQISCLATMGRELQSCSSESEVWQRAGRFVEQLFPGSGGQLLACRASGLPLEMAAAWGPPRDVCPKTLEDCPAVRGASLPVDGAPVSFACREEGVGAGRFCICVPIETRSEPLGVLRIWEPEGNGLSVEDAVASHYGDLAVAAAEQISPVLTNLSLRDAFRDLAMRDSLTGLYNRRFLEEALARELSRAEREMESLGILMLDLDHFKEFNDAYGHDAGDDILRTLGAFLTRRIRVTDVACRYGGEEFTLLLPGMSLEDTAARAEKIRGEVTEAIEVPGKERPITVSIGVAVYPLHGFSAEELLRAADVALYRAKANGRNRVEIFGGS